MTKTFSATPPIDAVALEQVTACLGEAPWHGFSEETLWAIKLGEGLYQLRNTPFFAKGLAYLDVVSANAANGRLMVVRVENASRHSTYRVHVKNATPKYAVQPLFDQLMALGCSYESYAASSWTLFAWDVPASAVDAAYKVLEVGERQGAWEFEEGHYGGREH